MLNMQFLEKWIYISLKRILKIFNKDVTDSFFDTVIQFVKFGIVGLSNTVVSYVLNVLVLLALQPFEVKWDFVAGNMVAFVLSVLWSFYWNNRLVFKAQNGEKRSIWRTLMKTYIAYGFTGIILNNVLSLLWISVLGISKYIAPLLNLVLSVPLNFIINKFWAFKA